VKNAGFLSFPTNTGHFSSRALFFAAKLWCLKNVANAEAIRWQLSLFSSLSFSFSPGLWHDGAQFLQTSNQMKKLAVSSVFSDYDG
jgi:hypothetical protein